MPKFKLLGCWFVCSVFTIVFSINSTFAEGIENEKTVKIAAGSVLEGYYFIGLRLCRYITESNNGIRGEVVPTTGSLENIDLLRKGEVDFAFTDTDPTTVRDHNGSIMQRVFRWRKASVDSLRGAI